MGSSKKYEIVHWHVSRPSRSQKSSAHQIICDIIRLRAGARSGPRSSGWMPAMVYEIVHPIASAGALAISRFRGWKSDASTPQASNVSSAIALRRSGSF